jgi:hypothetical protein
VPVIIVTLVGFLLRRRRAGHVLAQGAPQRGALMIVHHGQVKLDLFNTGNGAGDAMDLVCQFVRARPRSHREGQLNAHPPAADLHLAQHAERAQWQPEFGLDDGAECRFEL